MSNLSRTITMELRAKFEAHDDPTRDDEAALARAKAIKEQARRTTHRVLIRCVVVAY